MVIVFLAFISAACTSLPTPVSTATAPATAVTTLEAPYFALNGRLSIRQNDRLDSVKMIWTKTELEERLQFFTPFGSQIAEIVKVIRADKTVQVTLSNGNQITRAASMDELTEAALGVALEVDQIARWVQGIGLIENLPQDVRLSERGRDEGGAGNVWQVTAERFQAAPPYRYAARISAVKAGGDVSLKLVVDEWTAK